MKNLQSWVETTLPPGYVLVHSWAGRGWVWQEYGRQGWEATQADACRSAWRHWTAAVLRGRVSRWSYHVQDGNVAEHDFVHQTALPKWFSVMLERQETTSTVEMWAPSPGEYWIACSIGRRGMEEFDASSDIDEAMARFAALVLATEGPAMQRGDK